MERVSTKSFFSNARRPYLLNLPLVEHGDGVDDNPGEGASEVDNLMHSKADETSRQSVVLHPQVPGLGTNQ